MDQHFDEVMTEFAAEMEQFEATMREVDEILSRYDSVMAGDGDTPTGSPAAGD
ncbi:MAG: hypothetical protein ABEI77_06725 [Halorientalis sp.]